MMFTIEWNLEKSSVSPKALPTLCSKIVIASGDNCVSNTDFWVASKSDLQQVSSDTTFDDAMGLGPGNGFRQCPLQNMKVGQLHMCRLS